MEQLALDGGTPVRTAPFPPRVQFGDEEVELTTRALRSQNLFGPSGTMVAELERSFAELYGVQYAISSTSGTACLHVAVAGLNPEPGDEIIVGPITDAGSLIPILWQNCVPVFADLGEHYNMDPAEVERQITPRTRAIMAINLFGNPCDMEGMVQVAQRHGLALIEDCSQAHMTQYRGRLLGTFGDVGCFSFQQSKHMTTGEGGMTVTNDPHLAQRMRLFTDKAWPREPGARCYEFLGMNYRMTELQGAVGVAQVKKVAAVTDRRHELGEALSDGIRDLPGLRPAPVTPGGRHTYWLYPLLTEAWPAQRFAEALGAEGVPAGWGYTGVPIYLCMRPLVEKVLFGSSHHPLDGCHGGRVLDYGPGLCPRAEATLPRTVTLSLHEGYSEQDLADMAAAIRKVAEGLPPAE